MCPYTTKHCICSACCLLLHVAHSPEKIQANTIHVWHRAAYSNCVFHQMEQIRVKRMIASERKVEYTLYALYVSR